MGQQTMAEDFPSAKISSATSEMIDDCFRKLCGSTGPLREKLIFYSLRNSFLFKKLDVSLNISNALFNTSPRTSEGRSPGNVF